MVLGQPPNSWQPVFDKALVIKGDYQLTASSQVIADPLLFIHFILNSITPNANPARVSAEMLTGHLPEGHLLYQEIVFDFTTDTLSSKYINALTKLIKAVER